MIKSQENSQSPSDFKVMQLGIIIAVGNCCLGFTGMCLSSIEHILQNYNHLTIQQTIYHLSISTSSLNLGSLIGAFVYKKFQQYFGYTKGFKIIDVFSIIFLIIQLIDLNLYCLVFGRFFFGIFQTISLAMTTQFLNKISQSLKPSLKGTLGSFSQLLFVFGVIVAYLISYILPKQISQSDIQTQIRWRIYIGFPIIFCLIRLLGVLLIAQYNKIQQQSQIQLVRQHSSSKIQQILTKQKHSYHKRLIIAILVIASNQLSCINGIFFYARQMMELVTQGNQEMSKLLMLVLAFGQFIAALVSANFLNSYGRKTIFLRGQIVVVFILFFCYLLDFQNPLMSLLQRHILLGILINLHVIVFNLTLGPICIFYCSQILDNLQYVVLTLKVLSLFFALSSDYMIHEIGIGKMFFIFGTISFVIHVYLRFNMQQTMHLSKQEIYNRFIQKDIMVIQDVQEPQKDPFKHKNQKDKFKKIAFNCSINSNKR